MLHLFVSVLDNCSDSLSGLKNIEAIIDVFQWYSMCNHRTYVQISGDEELNQLLIGLSWLSVAEVAASHCLASEQVFHIDRHFVTLWKIIRLSY